MTFTLPPQIERQILDRVESGKYQSVEDVICAALFSLDQRESVRDFKQGELDRLIEEGERSGPPLDGEKVMEELRQLRASHKAKAG